MSAKDKFNTLINMIEDMVSAEHPLSAREIAEQLSEAFGLGHRDLCAIFSYLTDSSLLEYIKERKMMEAYKFLISIPSLNIEGAIELSGYDNQSSFSKKFRERFNMSPTEAFAQKDFSLILPARSWKQITSESASDWKAATPVQTVQNGKFGLTRKQYDRIMEAADYQALYEFNDIQSEAAFKIAEEMQSPLKVAFEFIDEYSREYCTDDAGNFAVTAEELDLLLATVPELKYVYFDVTHSVYESLNLIAEAKRIKCDLRKVDPDYLRFYLRSGWPLDRFLKLVDFFESNNGDDFEEFFRRVERGESPESALEEEKVELDFQIRESPAEIDNMFAFEEWAFAQTDYENAEKIDIDYDADNPYYCDEGGDNELEDCRDLINGGDPLDDPFMEDDDDAYERYCDEEDEEMERRRLLNAWMDDEMGFDEEDAPYSEER